MHHLSKSKYTAVWQCPKMAWLRKYMTDAAKPSASAEESMQRGREVGALARGLFGDYVDVTVTGENGCPDLSLMMKRTADQIRRGTAVICEAAFEYNGLYCAVDILRREGDGYAIYEVKSSTSADKEIYAADLAYQKYVLSHAGVVIQGTYLVSLNSSYVRNGALELDKLFKITDLSDSVHEQESAIVDNLLVAQTVLSSSAEPSVNLSLACNNPYLCSFFCHCTKHLPSPSIFDIRGLHFKEKLKLYRDGICSFEAADASGRIKNAKQKQQVRSYLGKEEDRVDVAAIRAFLSGLSYPLYFLDFETMLPAIPIYDGTHPYQMIPFQYSLHYVEQEGGELMHTEFLGEPEVDPRRALAEQLCRDIPMGVCVTAYNKGFECTRLTELADTFPDLAEHLKNIRDNVIDLCTPFQKGYYYTRAMEGSYSIKYVLPALYPDSPELNYHNLEGVHNGGVAMALFPRLSDLPPEERRQARHNLLKYCELDTLAMVRVYEALLRAIE